MRGGVRGPRERLLRRPARSTLGSRSLAVVGRFGVAVLLPHVSRPPAAGGGPLRSGLSRSLVALHPPPLPLLPGRIRRQGRRARAPPPAGGGARPLEPPAPEFLSPLAPSA